MSAPLTSTQIPDNSILDIFGRQTYLGNSFILPATGTSIANTVETPLCVVRNAAGSGKSLFLFDRKISTNNNPIIVRFYANPTLNVPGTTTAAVNIRSGATTTSISTCYLGMTITSNGTFLSALPAPVSTTETGLFYIIDPGNSLLVTAQQAAAGTSLAIVALTWYEI